MLNDFDPERMSGRQSASASAGKSGAAAGSSKPAADGNQILGHEVVDAQGQKIGKVGNVVADGEDRWVVIALGGPSAEVDKKMLVPRSELEMKDDQVVWSSEAAEGKAESKAMKQ